eukprot:COSAG03_NODE_654_length_6434_cov_349.926283_4_plen_605_part_00
MEGDNLRLRLVDADARRSCASAGVELRVTSVDADADAEQTTVGFAVDGSFQPVGASGTCTQNDDDSVSCPFDASAGCPAGCTYTAGPCNVVLIENRECLLHGARAGPGQLDQLTEFVHYELAAVARPCVYGCIDSDAANYAEPPGASCTETAKGAASVADDAARCNAVTELDNDVACAAIMGSASPGTGVCTYSPGARQLGVCEAKRTGCTDTNAANFNADANSPDYDACVYTALAHRFSCPQAGKMLPNSDYLNLAGEQDNPQRLEEQAAQGKTLVEQCAELCEQSDCLRFEFEALLGGGAMCYLGGQDSSFDPETSLETELLCSESPSGACADIVEAAACNSHRGCTHSGTACVSTCHAHVDRETCEGTGNCTFTLHFYFEKVIDEAATGCIYGCTDPTALNFRNIAVANRANCDPVSPQDCESCAHPSGCEHEGTCDALVRFNCPKQGQLAGHDIDFGGGESALQGVASAELCAAYCLANSGCVSFDHSLDMSLCHLGNAVEGPGRQVEPGTELGTSLAPACLSCAGQFGGYLYYELAEPDRSAVSDSANFRRGCAYGCTNSSAINFDVRREHDSEIQMIDDGSCVPRIEGCSDRHARLFL